MSRPAAPLPSASEPLNSLGPEWVGRFRGDVETLVARALDVESVSDPGVALAVSGGPDSMAMLALAHAAFPGNVIAATVDHGLRPEAAAEAALVASVCARLGIPHRTLTPAAPIAGSSIQKQAREARYAMLAQWAEAANVYPLLTAHHADDQAETLLMRLNRASGPAGLSGIRPFRFLGGCLLVRPLLNWRRERLRVIAEQADMPWIEDSSNTDPRHDRTRYRALLAEQELLDPAALAKAAAHIRESEEALEELARGYWADRWSERGSELRAAGLPRELQRRLVRRALAMVRENGHIALPPFSSASNIEALLDALETGQRATQAGVIVTPRGDKWHFAPAPPRRSQ